MNHVSYYIELIILSVQNYKQIASLDSLSKFQYQSSKMENIGNIIGLLCCNGYNLLYSKERLIHYEHTKLA